MNQFPESSLESARDRTPMCKSKRDFKQTLNPQRQGMPLPTSWSPDDRNGQMKSGFDTPFERSLSFTLTASRQFPPSS